MSKRTPIEYPEGCTIEQAYELYPANGLTMGAYMKHRIRFGLPGTNTTRLKAYVREGWFRLNEHGKLDPRTVDQAFVANINELYNPNRNRRQPNAQEFINATIPDLNESRSRREFAKAQMDELKLEQLRGALVSKADIDAALFDISRELRDGIMNIPVRIADVVASMTDASEVETYLEKEFEEVLESFAQRCENFSGFKPLEQEDEEDGA